MAIRPTLLQKLVRLAPSDASAESFIELVS